MSPFRNCVFNLCGLLMVLRLTTSFQLKTTMSSLVQKSLSNLTNLVHVCQSSPEIRHIFWEYHPTDVRGSLQGHWAGWVAVTTKETTCVANHRWVLWKNKKNGNADSFCPVETRRRTINRKPLNTLYWSDPWVIECPSSLSQINGHRLGPAHEHNGCVLIPRALACR